MNNFNSLKKSFGFLTAAILAAAQISCSNNATESEISIPESSGTETASTTVTETELQTTVSTSVTENLNNKLLSNLSQETDNKYDSIFSDRDLNPEFDNITAEIKLNGDSISCNNNGVSVNNSVATITKEGIYRISGTLNNGQIIVNAPDEKVQLILDNADIKCSTSSAIYGIDSKKIFISLTENSVNNLTDGENYTYSDETNQEPDSCIFSSDSLTINGTGTLNINSSLSGIHSKDDIVITNGNINITSEKDGIKGKDYIAVADGNVNINCGEDGMKSTNTNDTSLGYIYIQNGGFTINSVQDGIQAETDLVINGGNFDITSGGGSENSTKTHSDDFSGMGGGGFMHGDFDKKFDPENMTPPDNFNPQDFGDMTPPDNFDGGTPPEMQENQTDTSETVISTKGLKGSSSININGGEFNINSADDAVHSENVSINGGNFTITAGDDGIHANSNIYIEGGTINITDSYEGIESTVININGGDIKVNSSDDGFNASDGVTSQNGMGTYSDGVEININNGTVYINAEGDGLDSNGDLNINGGTVIIDGCTNGGNGALDSNSEIIVTGGTLIAVGNSQMAECPSDSSTQYTVSATFDNTQKAGTSVKLLDENGSEIIDFTSAKTFDNIVISSPDILKDKTYTFYLDDTESESFTASDIITTVGKQATMGGGFDNHGGRGDFQPPTNENGEFEMPDKKFGDKPDFT